MGPVASAGHGPHGATTEQYRENTYHLNRTCSGTLHHAVVFEVVYRFTQNIQQAFLFLF